MAAADNAAQVPFIAFNFAVEIHVPNLKGAGEPLCKGAFSECDGLELSMEVKTIREGGNNDRQIRLSGPVSYGLLTLKRGMTESFDLWRWFRQAQRDPTLRADADVIMVASSLERPPNAASDWSPIRARFTLSRCLPVKLRAPALNAKDGMVAIEELQVAYETAELVLPSGNQGG
jgi:phage tail-like protein